MLNRIVFLSLSMVFLFASELVAGEYNPVLDIGDKAPAWKKLPGVDGKMHSLDDLKKKEAVVVVFTCNSCPYAVDYEDRIISFTKKYAGEKNNVAVVAINVNKVDEDLLPEMKKRAKEKNFPFVYLFDETQQIARDYGAGYTPEFFVLNKEREVIYMGAMDDASDADRVKVNYVEQAVLSALKGGKPKTTETVAIGCRVRFERKRRKKKK